MRITYTRAVHSLYYTLKNNDDEITMESSLQLITTSKQMESRKTAIEDDTLSGSLRHLCRVLRSVTGVQCVVLVDEYDKPVNDLVRTFLTESSLQIWKSESPLQYEHLQGGKISEGVRDQVGDFSDSLVIQH